MGNIAHKHQGPEKTCPRPRGPAWRAGALIMTAGALALGVGLAACGRGSPPSGVAAGPTSTTAVRPSDDGAGGASSLLAYSSCMRSHGVPGFPDPTGDGGVPKAAVISAFQQVSNSQAQRASVDCARLLPPGGSLSGQPVQPVTLQDQEDYLKAADCMRSHGVVNFPGPIFSGDSVSFHIPSSIDPSSAQFAKARQTCAKLVPAGLPYSASGG